LLSRHVGDGLRQKPAAALAAKQAHKAAVTDELQRLQLRVRVSAFGMFDALAKACMF